MLEAKQSRSSSRRAPVDRPWEAGRKAYASPRVRSPKPPRSPFRLEKGEEEIEVLWEPSPVGKSRFSLLSLPISLKKPQRASLRPPCSTARTDVPLAWTTMPHKNSSSLPCPSPYASELSLSSIGPVTTFVGKQATTSTVAPRSLVSSDAPTEQHTTLYYVPSQLSSSPATSTLPQSASSASTARASLPRRPHASSTTVMNCTCDVDGETDVGGGASMRVICAAHGERPQTIFTNTTYLWPASKVGQSRVGKSGGWA